MFGLEHNVCVRLNHEHKPHFMFLFDGLAEPNLEHCLKCSEPDPGQSIPNQNPLSSVTHYPAPRQFLAGYVPPQYHIQVLPFLALFSLASAVAECRTLRINLTIACCKLDTFFPTLSLIVIRSSAFFLWLIVTYAQNGNQRNHVDLSFASLSSERLSPNICLFVHW